MLRPRHLLVFINPVGGQGKSEAEFTHHVKPLFDLAEINCSIVVTGGEEGEGDYCCKATIFSELLNLTKLPMNHETLNLLAINVRSKVTHVQQ